MKCVGSFVTCQEPPPASQNILAAPLHVTNTGVRVYTRVPGDTAPRDHISVGANSATRFNYSVDRTGNRYRTAIALKLYRVICKDQCTLYSIAWRLADWYLAAFLTHGSIISR